MTQIVSEQAYRLRTGDLRTPTEDVVQALLTAQALVEERLGRALAHGVYTENLIPSGASYLPSVTPLDPATTGYVDSVTLAMPLLPITFSPYTRAISVTYTGGWTATTLPEELNRAIALLAQANLDPSMPITGKPIVTRIGDLAVNTSDAKSAGFSPIWPAGLWASIKRYRRQSMVLT